MAKPPKKDEPEVDPEGGDEILKRMLKAKPKTHDEMVKQRRAPKSSATKKSK